MNPLFELFNISQKNPLRVYSPISIALIPLKAFFAIYFRLKDIREGVNDEILKYNIQKNLGIGIGKHTYGYLQLCQRYSKLKSIGAFCSIGGGVKIVGISHPLYYVTTSPVLYSKKWGLRNDDLDLLDFSNPKWDIHIGNDVYIGQYVKILPGVCIGDGAVIGANSTVTKDVPNYAIVAGSPTKIIQYRFSSEIIASLNRIKWWEWDDDKISQSLNLMLDVEAFVEAFDNEFRVAE